MIKLSSVISNTNFPTPKSFGESAIASSRVNSLIDTGNKYLNENKNELAINFFKEAKSINPDNVEIDKKLGKAYFKLNKYEESQSHFKIYLEQNPQDDEAWIELGRAQRKAGFYGDAIKSFQNAKQINPKNDLAKRALEETKNNILSIYAPEKALKEKQQQAYATLKSALDMTVNYLTPSFMKDLADVQVIFGETASMGGTPNIAQYENYKKTITISDTYIYAAPQVIAAYLIHESIHAKDKDAYTSVHEEQDAYEIATKFWKENANGIEDPEMDYAAGLYNQSVTKLRERVAEIYKMRDPSIAETSPNHPPSKKFPFMPTQKKIASQNLKTYEVIA